MPQKETFDWMRQQLNGHMRTQIIAAAATLSLADHLQDGPRTVDENARITGPGSAASVPMQRSYCFSN